MKVSEAASPDNLEWFNLGMKGNEKTKETIMSYLVVLFGLVLSFLVVATINQQEYGIVNQIRTPTFWQFLLIPVIVYFVNYLLRKVSKWLISKQRFTDQT